MNKFYRLMLSVTLLCISQIVMADRYMVADAIFTNRGWAKPLQGDLISDTDFNYDSQVYKRNFGYAHSGVDLVSSLGAPVYAIDAGEVLRVDRFPSENADVSSIFVQHEDVDGKAFMALYGHVLAIDGLKRGDTVEQGQKIGEVRRFNYPDHLHFTISTDPDDALYLGNWGAIYGSVTDPENFIANTRNTEASSVAQPVLDGAASLVDPAGSCVGCNHDKALLHAYDNQRSTVTVQWLYDAVSCSHINLTSSEAVSVKLRVKPWSQQDISQAFTATLSPNQALSIEAAADQNPWTLVAISSEKPLANSVELAAHCQQQGANLFKPEQVVNPEPLILQGGRQWSGSGSVISAINRTGHGADRDIVIASQDTASEALIQWYSGANCSQLQLNDYAQSAANLPVRVFSKRWDQAASAFEAVCEQLPCTVNSDKPDYRTIKLQMSKNAVSKINLQARCQ